VKLTEEELYNEIENLLDTTQKIEVKYNTIGETGLLFEGTSNADIEFPAEVKDALDKTRAKIRPTIPHHHYYKSAGYASLVDFAEMMVEDRPDERDYVRGKLDKVVSWDMPKKDDPINIVHTKLDGRCIVLSKGRVIDTSSNSVTVRRQFKYTTRKLKMTPENVGDVNVPRDDGDYSVTKAVQGSMIMLTDYYSRDDRHKGTYVNVNTGVEIYPGNGNVPSTIRYVDLEIDVVAPKRGQIRIIDQHLLKRAVQRGFITDEMADIARSKAKSEYRRIIEEAKKN
jgi:predicted RNA-binding protein associated with RNAse of E/G family